MTSSVKFEAHLSSDKVLVVVVTRGPQRGVHRLRDGERLDVTVCDNIRTASFEHSAHEEPVSPFPEGADSAD
jgi:hypothetical protein